MEGKRWWVHQQWLLSCFTHWRDEREAGIYFTTECEWERENQTNVLGWSVGNSCRLTLFHGELSSSISGHLEFPGLLLKPVNTRLSTARKPTWKCCTTIQSVQGKKTKKTKNQNKQCSMLIETNNEVSEWVSDRVNQNHMLQTAQAVFSCSWLCRCLSALTPDLVITKSFTCCANLFAS